MELDKSAISLEDSNKYSFFEITHNKFLIVLIVNRLAGRIPRYPSGRWLWLDRKKHIECFLNSYYEKYNKLPTGRHDLGTTERTNVHVGLVDFDRVRHDLLRGHTKKLQEKEEDFDSMINQIQWEMQIGIREQAAGRNPNPAIQRIRLRTT